MDIRGRRCQMRRQGPQTFSEEFRREAVRLANDKKRSIPELSVELGVSTTTLRNWLRTVPLEKPTSAGRVLSLEEQVRRLSRENERLREDREILRKAPALFLRTLAPGAARPLRAATAAAPARPIPPPALPHCRSRVARVWPTRAVGRASHRALGRPAPACRLLRDARQLTGPLPP